MLPHHVSGGNHFSRRMPWDSGWTTASCCATQGPSGEPYQTLLPILGFVEYDVRVRETPERGMANNETADSVDRVRQAKQVAWEPSRMLSSFGRFGLVRHSRRQLLQHLRGNSVGPCLHQVPVAEPNRLKTAVIVLLRLPVIDKLCDAIVSGPERPTDSRDTIALALVKEVLRQRTVLHGPFPARPIILVHWVGKHLRQVLAEMSGVDLSGFRECKAGSE